MSNAPVHKVKVGSVEVAIWANESEKYGTSYSFSAPTKNYKNKDGDWKKTTNLKSSEALNAIVCYQKCFEWVYLKDKPVENEPVSDSPI